MQQQGKKINWMHLIYPRKRILQSQRFVFYSRVRGFYWWVGVKINKNIITLIYSKILNYSSSKLKNL